MKRVFAVGVVLVVLAVGGTVWAAPIPAADDGVKEQIAEAYARVFDKSLPMRKRLAALEDGRMLRTAMKKFDSLKKVAGLDITTVRLSVFSVRAHGDNAEVQLNIYAGYGLATGWSGVARKNRGRWIVARDTVCTIWADWTPIRCPGGPEQVDYSQGHMAKATKQGTEMIVPLTFTDGDRADLVVPEDLARKWRIIPHAQVVLDEETTVNVYFQPGRASARQSVRIYPGAAGRPNVELDAMSGLVIPLGKWTAFVYAEQLSERERGLIAKHLDGYTTASGFPVLIPTGPLAFHRSNPASADGVVLVKSALNIDDAANPMELSYSDGGSVYVSIVITPGPCPAELQRPFLSGEYAAEERCTANGFGRIAVEGNADFVTRLLDELRVENYRAAPALTTA